MERNRHDQSNHAVAATAEPVHDVVFLFLTPSGAIARRLDRLDEAVSEVHRLVAAGE